MSTSRSWRVDLSFLVRRVPTRCTRSSWSRVSLLPAASISSLHSIVLYLGIIESKRSSRREVMSTAFTNGFVNMGFGSDKMLCDEDKAHKWFTQIQGIDTPASKSPFSPILLSAFTYAHSFRQCASAPCSSVLLDRQYGIDIPMGHRGRTRQDPRLLRL